MITLCMDTSHVFLALGLIEDDRILASFQEKCWKKQSEEIFPRLIEMCDSVNITPEMIDQIVISKGPGSYTGVRIAMTIAKIFCTMKNAPLYTIGTLQLYAGRNTCRVITDARGHRGYTNTFVNGIPQEQDEALDVETIRENYQNDWIIGDGHLIGSEDRWPDIIENFLTLKQEWTLCENAHLVVPEYLKSASSYMPQRK